MPRPKKTIIKGCLQCGGIVSYLESDSFCTKTCQRKWIKNKMKNEVQGIRVQINEKTWVYAKSEEDIPRVKAKWDKLLNGGLGLEKIIPVMSEQKKLEAGRRYRAKKASKAKIEHIKKKRRFYL